MKALPFLKEMVSFAVARGLTFLLDFAGVMFLVELVGAGKFISKCIMAVIVIIVNYILSKKYVFRRNKKQEG